MLKKYNMYNKTKALLAGLFVLGIIFYSCNKKDEVSTSTQLNSFGPSVNRGTDDLKFIGNNLNNVTSIILPDGIEIPASSFKSQTSTLIVITVPDEVVSGKVTLKTPQGDIVTKSNLIILEPITITSITPAKARPGDEITIVGTYLNLIKSVKLKNTNNKVITSFTSQSKTELKLIVPDYPVTGTIVVMDGEKIPNAIESTMPLQVTVPVITSISPLSLKAGGTLTITGTDLDLAKEVYFGGQKSVNTFPPGSKTATQIVVTPPWNTQDGTVKTLTPSGIFSESAQSVTMLLPTITTVTPNPVKNGSNITVTGTDLDLISSVAFGGNKTGVIQSGGTATQIMVKVPADATDGTITFNTNANKSVQSDAPVTMIVPTVTLLNPTSVNTASTPSITVTGTNLDLVNEIIFADNWSTKIFTSSSATSITVAVVPGSVSGAVKLITTNGSTVLTPTLTIVPDVPNITSIPTSAFIGGVLSITGTNMNVPAVITFPGGIVATDFGSKTSTLIQVRVPMSVAAGSGPVTFTTDKNEVYKSANVTFTFGGVEPIVDATKVIYNFDEVGLASGHTVTGWDNWGSVLTTGTVNGVSGNYIRGNNASTSSYWIWGCNHANLPKVSVTKADHLLKIDVKITAPLSSAVNFQIELGGTRIDLGNLGGSTNGWTTITYDLSTFSSLPATIPASGEWGLILQAGGPVDLTALYMDNFRFQLK